MSISWLSHIRFEDYWIYCLNCLLLRTSKHFTLACASTYGLSFLHLGRWLLPSGIYMGLIGKSEVYHYSLDLIVSTRSQWNSLLDARNGSCWSVMSSLHLLYRSPVVSPKLLRLGIHIYTIRMCIFAKIASGSIWNDDDVYISSNCSEYRIFLL